MSRGLKLLALAGLAICLASVCIASPEIVDVQPKTGAEPELETVPGMGRKMRAGAQEYVFQAEVNRLMDIIIHSLYSNKDIFLRELISNASDALDKIRFLSLTDKSVLGEGDDANLEIKISLDKENKVLTIRDRGIGMTHEDLVKNLGTIAKSGTSAFLEQMQKGGDINLIGQFGVGFYSVYLVSDWVEVISKHNDDKQYIWSSTADGSFSIIEDTENEPLGRGTMIKMHLKPEALEYAEEYKLKDLVHRYSEFMNFPIYLETEKEIEVPDETVEEEEEEAAEETKEGEEGKAEEGVEDEEEEEEQPVPKMRKEKTRSWELVNDNKAIWLRKPNDVAKDEYQKFYKAISKNQDEPLSWSHFKAEGDIEFKTVLYIPSTAPPQFYEKYYEKGTFNSIKLYVRRVFISDSIAELLPKYLSFIRGIVDSDTLPLNVSRELLQQHAALKTIKKKLVRKVLDMMKKMADDEKKCEEQRKEAEEKKKEGEEAADEADDDDKIPEEECKRFGTFWTQFGRAVKLGIIEDNTNRNRLAKLLRFHTSKSIDKLTSLDEYIGRMKEGQREIYFLAGQNKDEMVKSPFVERLLKKDYEVIYFTDVLDEYVMGHMLEYDDKKFADATKEDLKMSDKDEKEKKRDKELKEEFKNLTKWWKSTIGEGKVASVKISNRLQTTPCIVVAGKYGQSANMERIMRAQAFQDGRMAASAGQRVFEINPRHPLIKALKEKVAADEEDATLKSVGRLLYNTALLESGFQPEDVKDFGTSVHMLVKDTIGVESDLKEVEEEVEEPEEEAAAEEEAEAEPADEYEDEAEVDPPKDEAAKEEL